MGPNFQLDKCPELDQIQHVFQERGELLKEVSGKSLSLLTSWAIRYLPQNSLTRI